jgi:hypothetical protein
MAIIPSRELANVPQSRPRIVLVLSVAEFRRQSALAWSDDTLAAIHVEPADPGVFSAILWSMAWRFPPFDGSKRLYFRSPLADVSRGGGCGGENQNG